MKSGKIRREISIMHGIDGKNFRPSNNNNNNSAYNTNN